MNIFKNNFGEVVIINGVGKDRMGIVIEDKSNYVVLNVNGWPLCKYKKDLKFIKEVAK